jgi:2-polyprenyl-3-methyl-5-hydroxy-6-metoxy-1,4-benzoquinol methylase
MENKKSEKLKFTAERMSSHPKSLLYKTSLDRYKFAGKYTAGKNVLDIACGSGYGSAYLAEKASSVFGVDVDRETIEYCKHKYLQKNLHFLQIEKDQMMEEFKNRFDVVVSFETIEHISDYNKFLYILNTYLKNNGILILSTPNNFRHINPPENRFHVYEFDILELFEILKGIFNGYHIGIFGQGKTTFQRVSRDTREPWIKSLVQKIFKKIYNTDKRTINLLTKIEHLNIYKKISGWQKEADFSTGIYEIEPSDNFYNPAISLFVIKKF